MIAAGLAAMMALAIALAAPAAMGQEATGEPAAELAQVSAMEAGEGEHTHDGGEAHTHDDASGEHTHDDDQGGAMEEAPPAAAEPPMATEEDALNIVINEIEINPFGEDGFNTFEWVELYNPTSAIVDIGGWTVTSGVTQTTTAVPSGVIMRPGQFFTFTRTGEWLVNVAESAILRNLQGEIIDETPRFIDVEDDLDTWQRKHDALDTDSRDDWKFELYTRGLSNGKADVSNVPETISIHVTTDREVYAPGDTVIISGSVGGVRPASTAFFLPAQVKIIVNGTDYSSVTSITPGPDLEYSTSVKLREALGSGLGDYDVVATYVGSTAATSFIVAGEEAEPVEPEPVLDGLAIRTDSESYLPGNTVTIYAASSQTFPLQGLEYDIISPDGITIESGVAFPSGVQREPIAKIPGGGSQFIGTVYISAIEPVYGSYSVVGQYGTLVASTAFALDEDIKEDTHISLAPDKPVYGLGDTVRIDGRVNKVWADTVTLNVKQIPSTISRTVISEAGVTTFDVNVQLRPSSDGRFDHEFTIPNDDIRLGRYTVSSSDGALSATTSFRVVEEPESHTDGIFTIRTDSDSYSIGDNFIIRGVLGKLDPLYQSAIVIVKFLAKGAGAGDSLLLPATPDAAGNYYVTNSLDRGIFEPGEYDVTAMYMRGSVETILGTVKESVREGRTVASVGYDFVGTYHTKALTAKPEHTASTTITVDDPRDLGGAHFTANLERKIFTFGDTVRVYGLTAVTMSVPTLEATITRPNGKSTSSTIQVDDDGTYEWGWQAPSERHESNIGPYLLTISSTNAARELVFSVGGSDTAAEDAPPITVNVDGDSHMQGSTATVSGTVKIAERRGTYSYPSNDQVRIVIADANDPRDVRNEVFVTPSRAGMFSLDEKIVASVYPDGPYVVTTTYLGNKARDTFYVGDVPDGARTPSVSLAVPSAPAVSEAPTRTVEEDKVSGTSTSISVAAHDVRGTILLPRSLSVTLSAESGTDASLNIMYGEDTCVLGSTPGCLIDGPTRTAGSLYRTVSIGAFEFDIRYSGDGTDPVRFTAIPSMRGDSLPDSTWDVEASNANDATISYKTVYTAQAP